MRRPAPLSHEGRQTLVYVIFAGAGPMLTLVVIWAMSEALGRPALFKTFGWLAMTVAAALFVIVTALGMFVSIRAVKIGKDGFEATGGNAPAAAQAVADSAQETADTIKEESK